MKKFKNKKKPLLVEFDESLFLEVKKHLFKKNLTPQQFINFIFHKVALNDQSALHLLDEACEFFLEKHDGFKGKSKFNDEDLYNLIEREECEYENN